MQHYSVVGKKLSRKCLQVCPKFISVPKNIRRRRRSTESDPEIFEGAELGGLGERGGSPQLDQTQSPSRRSGGQKLKHNF